MSPTPTLFWMFLSCSIVQMLLASSKLEPRPCAPINIGYEVGSTHVAYARGCYHSSDSTETFPHNHLVNFRNNIDWNLWVAEGSGKQIIVECAKVALQRGFPTFGIEYYGECSYGTDPDLSQGAVTASDDCSKCNWDVGGTNVVFIYDLFEWYSE